MNIRLALAMLVVLCNLRKKQKDKTEIILPKSLRISEAILVPIPYSFNRDRSLGMIMGVNKYRTRIDL